MSAGHEVQVEKCFSCGTYRLLGKERRKGGTRKAAGEVTMHTSGADEQFKLLNPEHPLETQNRMKAQVGKYTYLDLM